MQNANNITNTKTISTSGTDSAGIVGVDDNTISNTGTISTIGSGSDGIFALDNNTIRNSGTISTSGDGAEGITIGDNNTVFNTGKILTSGSNSRSFVAGSGNTITNSGEIATTNLNGSVFLGVSNTFINTGKITVTGANAKGFEVGNNNTISNSGKIVSAQSFSFDFIGTGSSLNLQAPSFVGGEINLGTSTQVSIVTGASHSVLWDFSTGTLTGGTPTISGQVPYFYNSTTLQFATFEPSAFSTAPDFLADVSGGASAIAQNRLNRTRFRCNNCVCITPWVSIYGSDFNYGANKALLKRDVNYWNILAGAEASLPCQVTTGIMAGYGKGCIESNSRFYKSFNNSAEGFVGGGYVCKIMNSYFMDLTLSGGYLSHSDKRYVNNNLSPFGEAPNAKADYSSWWISPEVGIGAQFDCFCTSFIPNIRYRYAYQNVGRYHESGTTENAIVCSRDVQVGELKVEALVKREFNIFHLSLKGGYLLRNPIGNNYAKVTLISQTETIPSFADSHSCGYVGANFLLCIKSGAQLSAEGEYVSGNRMNGFRGMVNLSQSF